MYWKTEFTLWRSSMAQQWLFRPFRQMWFYMYQECLVSSLEISILILEHSAILLGKVTVSSVPCVNLNYITTMIFLKVHGTQFKFHTLWKTRQLKAKLWLNTETSTRELLHMHCDCWKGKNLQLMTMSMSITDFMTNTLKFLRTTLASLLPMLKILHSKLWWKTWNGLKCLCLGNGIIYELILAKES